MKVASKTFPIFLKWFLRSIVVAVLLLVIISFLNSKKTALCNKCNIVLVSLDTLSALHLPCYGYERDTAPNLCAYAKNSLFFLNSYSQAPITLDSHFSIFTSLYPSTHQMTKIYGNSLNEKYLTLTQVLRDNGYKTIYNGPLGDEHLPLNRGIERGFNIIEGAGTDQWGKSLEKLLKNANNNQSTFLFLHTYAVHSPYLTGHRKPHLFTNLPEYENIPLDAKEYQEVTPEFLSFAANKISERMFYLSNSKTREMDLEIAKSLLKKTLSYQDKVTLFNKLSPQIRVFCFSLWSQENLNLKDKNQIEYLRALYDEKIHDLDKNLQKLFTFLSNPKLSANTVVIITSDHGEEFMEHEAIFHGNNIFQTSTRVPLIIHIPVVKAAEYTDMVQGIDIYPTVLSVVGLKPESKIQGIDLVGMIRGDKKAPRNEYLKSEFKGAIGLQVKNWRYYYDVLSSSTTGLYNLSIDPKEHNNQMYNNASEISHFRQILQKQ